MGGNKRLQSLGWFCLLQRTKIFNVFRRWIAGEKEQPLHPQNEGTAAEARRRTNKQPLCTEARSPQSTCDNHYIHLTSVTGTGSRTKMGMFWLQWDCLLKSVNHSVHQISYTLFCRKNWCVLQSPSLSFFAGLAVADLVCVITVFWSSICLNPLLVSRRLPFASLDVMHLTGAWPHFIFNRHLYFVLLCVEPNL